MSVLKFFLPLSLAAGVATADAVNSGEHTADGDQARIADLATTCAYYDAISKRDRATKAETALARVATDCRRIERILSKSATQGHDGNEDIAEAATVYASVLASTHLKILVEDHDHRHEMTAQYGSNDSFAQNGLGRISLSWILRTSEIAQAYIDFERIRVRSAENSPDPAQLSEPTP